MMSILEDVIIEQKLGLYNHRPDRHRMDGLCILFSLGGGCCAPLPVEFPIN